MRITAIVLSLLCSVICSWADDTLRAEIRVTYNYHKIFVRGEDGVVESDTPMTLLANTHNSKFYNSHSEYLDSLKSTPSGRAKWNEISRVAAHQFLETRNMESLAPTTYPSYLYLFKSADRQTLTLYDNAGLNEYGVYTEPLFEMEWEICDSTRSILGYECILAQTSYHGRDWQAWFTPDIPLPDGPWKLGGLPGLILEATESDGHHSFTATGFVKSDEEMHPVYLKDRYDRMSRKDMLRSLRAYRDNGNAMIKASTNLDFGSQPTPALDLTKYDFLETDYHE